MVYEDVHGHARHHRYPTHIASAEDVRPTPSTLSAACLYIRYHQPQPPGAVTQRLAVVNFCWLNRPFDAASINIFTGNRHFNEEDGCIFASAPLPYHFRAIGNVYRLADA